ncbi:unnamed protein product [Peniophora sp. CBMAI 1063]|nr:unnamed protein product [Peniophora sp. CBMAI 1063]
MYGDTRLDLIHDVVASKHEHGILMYILKSEELCRRIQAVAIRYNNGDPAGPNTFRAFVRSCYHEGHCRPRIPFVPGAIAFYARPDLKCSNVAHTYTSTSGQQWYILDVAANDLSRIVPLGLYMPYRELAPGRTASILDSIEPIPLWVVGNGSLGVPVGPQGDVCTWQHGEKPFTNTNGSPRSTVFVRIKWPGYNIWESQIRMKNDSRPEDSYTFRRLVNQTRMKVRKFVSDNTSTPCRNSRWVVGDMPGQISAKDLILLAVVVVSHGAIMPILKLRDDYVLRNSCPFQTASTVPPFHVYGSSLAPCSYDPFGSDNQELSSLGQFDYVQMPCY